ncbi:LytR/AlgR family response regulator transcription factor [Parapedobacter sp. 2B3]|uniref:LytR/AlgR family response regulator transcription factor n=1 Tax=Parapedobacter sp. 2B3 TaxID=3342381 RepID=UPI0035B5901D
MEPVIYFVLLEDDPEAQKLVMAYFNEFPNFKCVGCFTRAGDARAFLLENPAHLIVADIQLPDMNGIDMIASLPKRPLVVLMTGHNSKKKATKGYGLEAVHYLTKPFAFREFQEAMNRVVKRVQGKPQTDPSLGERVVFGEGSEALQILPAEVKYFEVEGNEVTFHLSNDETLSIRITLEKVLAKLPSSHFVQVHRSYVVNLWHLKRLRRDTVSFYGSDETVPVSRRKRGALKKRLNDLKA